MGGILWSQKLTALNTVSQQALVQWPNCRENATNNILQTNVFNKRYTSYHLPINW
uniref:Uncharacterized protein n=1 Tax=Anguilla anguilla TaxID=7936 RepID=A0A0E9TIS2_ANGAN